MIKFSDHSEVIAALAVSEDTDNDSLILARDNFIMMAKMAHPDQFAETEESFRDGNSVTFVAKAKLVERCSRILSPRGSKKKSPWIEIFSSFATK